MAITKKVQRAGKAVKTGARKTARAVDRAVVEPIKHGAKKVAKKVAKAVVKPVAHLVHADHQKAAKSRPSHAKKATK